MNKVFTFHDIIDANRFEKIISIIKSKYTIVSIKDIESFYYEDINLKNFCHITFDDGERSFYELVYPILKRHKIPATIFISPKICRERSNFWFQEISDYNNQELKRIISENYPLELNDLRKHSIYSIFKCFKIDQIWNIIELYQKRFKVNPKESANINIDQLKEIDREGLVTIGAHTLNHPILANEDDLTCKTEIIESFKGLEEILGHKIKYFAFPNGWPNIDFGSREIAILKDIDCKVAFSCSHKNITKYDNPLFINRYNLSIGNLQFIRIKLFLGEYWEIIKNLIIQGDISSRKKIKKNALKFFRGYRK